MAALPRPHRSTLMGSHARRRGHIAAGPEFREEAWVILTQKAPSHETDVVGLVKPLLGNVIELLTVDTVYDASAELLIEALSNNPSLFTPETNEVLEILFKSPWAAEYYQRMTDGDFAFDSIQFAQLLLAFAEARMPLLVQNCHADSSEILSHLCDLLLAQGYPVVEDRIFVPLVEFWSSFAETIPDHLSVDVSEEEPWKAPAYTLLMKACSNAWQKITYPPSAAVADWDSNDRAGFADSRKDVVDLLQSVYALVGPQLLGRFAATVLLSLKDAAWLRLEAAVYCLGGLADCCQVDDRCDTFLAAHLHTEIDAFLAEYARVVSQQQLDCVTSERTIGALSSVAQAISSPPQRYSQYGRILEFIEMDLRKCLRLSMQKGDDSDLPQLVCLDTSPEENPSLHMALKVLRCLAGMGKGVQAPPENAINLEHEKQPAVLHDDVLPQLQRRIVTVIVELQKMFPNSSEITEQICHVLRNGFSETEAGPFVLPPSEVAQYLTSHSFATPRVGLFISTACSFTSSVGGKNSQQGILSAVLAWVIGLLRQFPYDNTGAAAGASQIDISAEPEVAQNAMEISSRILTKDPSVILHIQPAEMAEFFFLFALQALDGNEPLPKAAAAEFWVCAISADEITPY
ncbi:hypothetical protein MY10362_003786 [Beauveria mimosiformis]